MAHTKSARKRARQNEKRRLRNRRRLAPAKQAVRSYQEALSDGDTGRATEGLKNVYRQLDRVAAKGTLHKKTASRRKSRLAKKLATKKP